jgi:hypothetical protein
LFKPIARTNFLTSFLFGATRLGGGVALPFLPIQKKSKREKRKLKKQNEKARKIILSLYL